MKTLSKLGMMLTLATSLFLASCAGSYYVSDQPVEPVYARPAPPYDGAIWIDGEWGWSGGRYQYMRGHWDRARPGHTYIRGSWEHGNRGYRWHKGRWN
ncbi:YXWGXW repeat-containing protein [Mucilaginibacter frigoritolerans]|uniref:YXWGXW repeat-containing protein n=1 Tax=Mucilaginibacter frigoritolerans TaxID=652788 RepID=A0A562TX66_9SPHI|nr:YXWGXW repeat-containing protein [Mucilaginibacter frigoritolerans]TWI98137.1 YXWGXW repeat-containing protein [Mucilaginibacter frigoritolerans]